MKHIATLALMLNLGIASVYAEQHPVKMVFSGTGAASTVILQQPDASNNEDNLAGKGTLGSFTFRNVRAIENSPTSSSTCSGPNKLYLQRSGRRRRISLPGRESIEGHSHAWGRLHRFGGG